MKLKFIFYFIILFLWFSCNTNKIISKKNFYKKRIEIIIQRNYVCSDTLSLNFSYRDTKDTLDFLIEPNTNICNIFKDGLKNKKAIVLTLNLGKNQDRFRLDNYYVRFFSNSNLDSIVDFKYGTPHGDILRDTNIIDTNSIRFKLVNLEYKNLRYSKLMDTINVQMTICLKKDDFKSKLKDTIFIKTPIIMI